MRGYYPGEREHRERPPRPHPRRPIAEPPRPVPPQPAQQPPAQAQQPAAPARPQAKPKGRAEPDKKKAPHRGRRIDWVIGIVLGIVLGIGVVAGFLVFGSEDTIDAPSISKPAGGQPAKEAEPATAPSAER